MDEEKAVSFAEHVFFDDMLEDFPKSGPIRNYMEQVTVGLSQNPHLSVEEKREHVAWYKNYFQGKAETLKDFFGETGELKDFLSKENSKQKKESTSDQILFQLKCCVRYDSEQVFVSVCLYFEREMSI